MSALKYVGHMATAYDMEYIWVALDRLKNGRHRKMSKERLQPCGPVPASRHCNGRMYPVTREKVLGCEMQSTKFRCGYLSLDDILRDKTGKEPIYAW